VIECLEPEGRPFVTACVAIVDHARGHLRVASAGHPPLLLVRDGRASFLDIPPGPPLAAFPEASWTTVDVDLVGGDLLIGYTDGLVEVRGEHIDQGLERFRRTTLEQANELDDVGALADAIARAVTDPDDDLAVLVARFNG
jgi:serine phosphatase RsbU (regulator of sigma subunit)